MRDDRIDTTDYAVDIELDCPRCGQPRTERLYGPCESCRSELRETLGSDGSEVAVAVEYVPKMNVTPNAVALKDD